MHTSLQTRIMNCICVILVLLAGCLRLTRPHTYLGTDNVLIYLLFAAAALIWVVQTRNRLIQKQIRRYLTWMIGFILLLLLIRTIKYVFLPEESALARYAWYLYYFPQTFMVLLMFFSVLHIGKPYGEKISRWWKLLYLPATALVLGILTNDLHEKAFFFVNGMTEWETYTRGILYYLSLFWLGGLFIAMLGIALVRCAVSENRKNVWMPLLPLAAGLLYTIAYIRNPSGIFAGLYKTAEMICFIFPAFMEGLIQAHLFPSNDSYGALWNHSGLGCGIMDEEGQIRYRAKAARTVTKEEVLQALQKEVLFKDGRTVLRSHKVTGGYGYWIRDISGILQINQKLEELGDVLAEENAMLEGENRLAEKKNRIQQQARIYNAISEEVKDQLKQLGKCLEHLPEDETEFERVMKEASVLMTYIKRCSNLLLLSYQKQKIDGNELYLAIQESLEYIRFGGVKVHGEVHGEAFLPGKQVLFAYRIFEKILECSVPGADAVLAGLELDKGIRLQLEISSPREIFPVSEWKEKLEECGGTLQAELEEQTEFLTLTFGEGGGEYASI